MPHLIDFLIEPSWSLVLSKSAKVELSSWAKMKHCFILAQLLNSTPLKKKVKNSLIA
jgi:hypothetical protein